MDLEGIILSEVSQTKTNNIWFHLYGKSKKPKQLNKQSQTRLLETESKGTVVRGEGGGGCAKKVKGNIVNNVL